MQLQQLAQQTWYDSHKEVFKDTVPLDSFFFIPARRAHSELRDIIRQLQQESGLSRIVKKFDSKKKRKKEKNGKPTAGIEGDADSEKNERFPAIAGYNLHDLRDSYLKSISFLLQQLYSGVNVYELHYGSVATARISKEEENESQSDTTTATKQEQQIEEESPERMNQTIQHIINAKLFGALSDISADEKERFRNWREFNKHLRRLYEGAHYFSSITKFV